MDLTNGLLSKLLKLSNMLAGVGATLDLGEQPPQPPGEARSGLEPGPPAIENRLSLAAENLDTAIEDIDLMTRRAAELNERAAMLVRRVG